MLINQDEIPAGLAPGTYCCRLDESSHWGDFRARLVIPPRAHEPGDCLIQVIKTDPVPGTGDESEEG
jgi:hypothetical protein